MDSTRNKRLMQVAIWGVVAFATVMVGCQLFQPQNGWNKKKWGPLVPHTRFPGDCSICHLPERWDKLRDDFAFDHEKETGYPLKGAHAQAACLRCHNDRGPVTAYVARGCAGCHLDPHAAAMGMDCSQCHSEISWAPIGLISEHARTRFPLIGAHAVANCESCHEGAAAGRFQGAPLQCEVCHQDDLARALSPNHFSNGWINDCQECHQPSGWGRAFINHSFFRLSGGHGGLDCTQCHVSGTFNGLSSDCYSCHSSDYVRADQHQANSYSLNCTECHTINGWTPANIDHSFFPLTGGHAGLNCADCHGGSVQTPVASDCNSCHNADYVSAPDHQILGFPLDCTECHTVARWTPANFSHSFPLVGNHNASCITCHDSGSTSSFTCFNCHEHRQSEADDEHKEVSGYSYTSSACYSCHPDGRD